MTTPKAEGPRRWLDGPASDAPEGAVELLKRATPTPPMPKELWVRSADQLARLGPSRQTTALFLQVIAAAAMVALAAVGGLLSATERLQGELPLLAGDLDPVAVQEVSKAQGLSQTTSAVEDAPAEASPPTAQPHPAPVSKARGGAGPSTSATAAKKSAPTAEAAATATPSPPAPLEGELALTGAAREGQLLERARAALVAGDPRAALDHLGEHETEFPASALTDRRRHLEDLVRDQLDDGSRLAAKSEGAPSEEPLAKHHEGHQNRRNFSKAQAQ